jgi:hypothetical protein
MINGRALHLQGISPTTAREKLEALGVSAAVLAHNRRWLSFVPTGEGQLDPAALARAFDTHLADVRLNDEFGVVVTWHGPTGQLGVLALCSEIDDDDEPLLDEKAVALLGELVRRKVIPATARRTLERRLAAGQELRGEWLLDDEFSATLGFAFVAVFPVDTLGNADARKLQKELPDAVLVTAAEPPAPARPATRKARTKTSPAPPPVASEAPAPAPVTPEQAAVAELHAHFWLQVWDGMFIDPLHARYHALLPDAEKHLADQVINLVGIGRNRAKVTALLERILAATWGRQDWVAMVLKMKLPAPGSARDRKALAEWQRLLEAARRASA